jgi:hypothetical protein
MSDMAKQARAAMKAKAKSLTSADPHQKVDSSTWSPAEPLNADVKTGLRPISRRAFKAGGKVEGAKAKMNLGKGIRGGNKPITPDNFANKDVKAANEDRPGLKHVGGLKTGGRAKKNNGGLTIEEIIEKDKSVPAANPGPMTRAEAGIKPGSSSPASRAASAAAFDKEQQEYQRKMPQNQKSGGRAKKADGGDLSQYGAGVAGAADMMKKAAGRAGVPGGLYGAGFSKTQKGALSPLKATGMKKGGEAHTDEKMDIALIKKMVKPSARKGRDDGGRSPTYRRDQVEELMRNDFRSPKEMGTGERIATGAKVLGKAMAEPVMRGGAYVMDQMGLKKGGRAARATGGEVFSGPSYPGKIPGVVPGGRTARATGGKTKGKTNINIVIAAGKPAGQADMMPPGGPTLPPGMGGAPGGIPVAVPPPQAGGMPAGAPPMPMPPMPGPAAGGMPTPRKDGGRLTQVAKSDTDMEAGAGGGEGRLQKTDIAKRHQDAPNFKKGGKVYRSFKDMDAGAGSGMGRLEKTEIQKRKG